jgi:hypothetical protein
MESWRAHQGLEEADTRQCCIPFGVQVYRQLSVAVTEKHVKQISNLFNRYDDKTAMADLEVVFAWQSGHRPIQRETTYGIDGAYPDSLQPALPRRDSQGDFGDISKIIPLIMTS